MYKQYVWILAGGHGGLVVKETDLIPERTARAILVVLWP